MRIKHFLISLTSVKKSKHKSFGVNLYVTSIMTKQIAR